MTLDNLLLLDVGGTFIKCSDGREIPIDSNGPREAICASFAEAVGPFLATALAPAAPESIPTSPAAPESRQGRDIGICPASSQASAVGQNLSSLHAAAVAGIAVAMPGPFDYAGGVFLMKHKFAAVYGENFCQVAGIPEAVEVRYTHDVNGMLNGEVTYGNGRGFQRVAMVTLGTGLGFSMYVDGKILTNQYGSPLVSIFNRPFRDGVLEDFASKRGFLSTYERIAGRSAETVKEIGMMASEGDPAALQTFEEVAGVISSAIASILEDYGIECLLFGGQISRSFKYMEEAMASGLKNVVSLRRICTVSDFDNATFNGLKSLFE